MTTPRPDSTPDAMTLTPEDEARLRALFALVTWTYAKTMPRWPHWYTVRERDWADRDADFVWAVETIRGKGYNDWWGRRFNRAIVLDGMKYWTMDWPIERTIIINRKPVDVSPGDA
jgi:hypothetical protein